MQCQLCQRLFTWPVGCIMDARDLVCGFAGSNVWGASIDSLRFWVGLLMIRGLARVGARREGLVGET